MFICTEQKRLPKLHVYSRSHGMQLQMRGDGTENLVVLFRLDKISLQLGPNSLIDPKTDLKCCKTELCCP